MKASAASGESLGLTVALPLHFARRCESESGFLW